MDRKPLLRGVAAAMAALALAGCAALHIDVDVYKGPLVNNDDVQRDQLLAMAMSAKPLLLEMRNRMLDGIGDPTWRKMHPHDRRLTLSPLVLDQFYMNASNVESERESRLRLLRSARQINSVLSVYDDRTDPRFLEIASNLRRDEATYQRLHGAYLERAARRPIASDPETEKAFRLAHEARVPVWLELVELLREIGARQRSGDQRPALRQFAERTSTWVAERTQPWLLACVISQHRAFDVALVELADRLKEPDATTNPRPSQWGAAQYSRTRDALRRALQREPDRVAELLLAADARLRRFGVLGCTQGAIAEQAAPVPRDAKRAWLTSTGLVREPSERARGMVGDDGEDESESQAVGEAAAQLAHIDAGGFDHGRPAEGLDRLANRYASKRDQAIQDAEPGGFSAAQRDFSRIEHLLVDMAARMQFLATNLWLIEDLTASRAAAYSDGTDPERSRADAISKEDVGRYKTMLEAVANNLLVHADDLRRRGQHDDAQRVAATAERQAANRAALQGGFDDILAALAARRAEVASAAAASAAGNTKLSKVQGLIKELEPKVQETVEPRQKAGAALEQSLALARTLGAPLREGACVPVPGDGPVRCNQDAETIRTALSKGNTATLEATRNQLASQLGDLLARATEESAAGGRTKRLAAASQGLGRLPVLDDVKKGKPPVQHKALLDAALRLLAADAARWSEEMAVAQPLIDELAKARAAETTLSTAASAAGPSVQDLDSYRARILEAKGDVLKQVADAGGVADGPTTLLVLKSQLRAKVDASKKVEAPQVLLAGTLAVLDQLSLPATPAPIGGERVIEVLDQRIAGLRHEVIDAIRRHGKDSPEALKADAAFMRALKERESQIYIRPATAFLRSVHTSTSTQSDPGLGWQNLLLEKVKRLFQNDRVAATRVDLDKTYWQNINTVSVSASGSSNFVVTKDDVGNWYVKSMGADPAAMVKAAKGLALFNMSGRLDANLLRIDELRGGIDNPTTSDSRREQMREELRGLTAGASGPAVGARSETLRLFSKNYDEQTSANLKDLNTALGDMTYLRRIEQAWAAVYAGEGEAAKLAELKKVLELQAVKERHLDATEASAAAGASPAQAIIKTLQALQSLRSAVQAGVQQAESLVADERKADKDQKLLLEGGTARMQAAIRDFAAANAAGSTEGKERASAEHKAAQAALVDLKKNADLAAATLDKALRNRNDAAAKADAVLKGVIDEMVALRLRVVQETETAVKVIGRSAGS